MTISTGRETSTSAPVPVVSGNGNPLESKKSSEGRQSVPFKTATLERSKPQPDKLPLPPSILSGSQLQKIRDLKDDDQPSPPEINKWGKDECKLCRKNGAPGRKHHPEYCIFNGEACDECGYFQGGGTVHRRDCSKEENVQIPPIQSTALGKRKKTHKPPPSPKVTSKSNGMQTTPGLSRTDGKGNTPKPTPPTRNVAPKGNGMQTVPGPSGPIGKSNTPTSSCPSRKVSQAQIDALSPFNVPVNDRRPRPDDIDAIRYGWTLAAGIFLQEEILAKGQKISNDDWLALTNVAIRIWELRRGDDD